GLYAFIINASAKRKDLQRDGRYALHAHQDPDHPNEFAVRGHARLVADPRVRARISDGWFFTVDDTYSLFEFGIESAIYGARDDPNDWPPVYTTWAARR